MLTTLDLLDEIEKTHGGCTDYRAAQLLQVTRATLSQWRRRGTVMDDETAIKAADLLDLNPEYVVACIHAERVKNRASYHLLARIAGRINPQAIAASLAVLAVFYTAAPALPFFA